MIWRIAKKELTEIVRDGRFRLLAALVLTVAAVSLAAGWAHHRAVRTQHDEARRATRAQWLNQPAKNPHSAAHYGVYAFKPASALSLVDTGIEPYVGVAAWLEAHKQNEFKYRPAQDRTALQRFGELTAAESLLVLAPLFIVLVAFPVFSGEREQGTLRQLMAIGVTRAQLAWGKALGLSAALALVLVPVTVLGVVALALTGDGLAWREGSRGGLLVLAYLAYFGTFLAVALGVSARVASSRLGLVILLAFWFANSFLASRAAADLAGVAHPTPSAAAFQRALDADLNDDAEMARRLEARKVALLREHDAASLEGLPVNFAGISLQEGEEHGNEVFDHHFAQLFDGYDRQNGVMQAAGIAAPFLPMRALSMALAGTDFPHHRAFVRAAEDYRRSIQRVMNDDIAAHTQAGYTAGPELWARVPAFSYDAPGAGWAIGHARASVLLLAAWLIGATLFAARGAARLEVL